MANTPEPKNQYGLFKTYRFRWFVNRAGSRLVTHRHVEGGMTSQIRISGSNIETCTIGDSDISTVKIKICSPVLYSCCQYWSLFVCSTFLALRKRLKCAIFSPTYTTTKCHRHDGCHLQTKRPSLVETNRIVLDREEGDQ
jgi:hypothetical protein